MGTLSDKDIEKLAIRFADTVLNDQQLRDDAGDATWHVLKKALFPSWLQGKSKPPPDQTPKDEPNDPRDVLPPRMEPDDPLPSAPEAAVQTDAGEAAGSSAPIATEETVVSSEAADVGEPSTSSEAG